MVIFPLAPDQTIAQMWSNGARGGTQLQTRNLNIQTTRHKTIPTYAYTWVFCDIWPGNVQDYNTENEAYKGQRFLTFY